MKKPIFTILCVILCTLAFAGCAEQTELGDLAGAWENENAEIYFNEDGTYEIKYSEFDVGQLASENGKFEISGGKIEFKIRDKYTLSDTGDIKFERLIHTENRKEKFSIDSDTLTLNKIVYIRKEIN